MTREELKQAEQDGMEKESEVMSKIINLAYGNLEPEKAGELIRLVQEAKRARQEWVRAIWQDPSDKD